MAVPVKFTKAHPLTKTPTYSTQGAACVDLYSVEYKTIEPGASMPVRTGLCVAVPEGYALMLYSRSGHGFTYGIRLGNCVGVIDADYRGEIMVLLHNDGVCLANFTVKPGDRIAQAMMIPIPEIRFDEVPSLDTTARGTNGLGSTGR